MRLVLTPESVVVAEARRALTQLALYGYRVDGVVANRVFEAGDDPGVRDGRSRSAVCSAEVADSFDPLADLHRWIPVGRTGGG